MRQKSGLSTSASERIVNDIRRATRKLHALANYERMTAVMDEFSELERLERRIEEAHAVWKAAQGAEQGANLHLEGKEPASPADAAKPSIKPLRTKIQSILIVRAGLGGMLAPATGDDGYDQTERRHTGANHFSSGGRRPCDVRHVA